MSKGRLILGLGIMILTYDFESLIFVLDVRVTHLKVVVCQSIRLKGKIQIIDSSYLLRDLLTRKWRLVN